jgi:hypothetical protein
VHARLWKEWNGDKWHRNRRENFEEVASFKYLGSLITSSNDSAVDIKEKIAVDNKCLYSVGSVFRATYVYIQENQIQPGHL